MVENILQYYKTTIEQRLREQLDRHRRVDPMVATDPIVDIQIRQERERLEKLAAEKPQLEELIDVLNKWLDELTLKFKRR